MGNYEHRILDDNSEPSSLTSFEKYGQKQICHIPTKAVIPNLE